MFFKIFILSMLFHFQVFRKWCFNMLVATATGFFINNVFLCRSFTGMFLHSKSAVIQIRGFIYKYLSLGFIFLFGQRTPIPTLYTIFAICTISYKTSTLWTFFAICTISNTTLKLLTFPTKFFRLCIQKH